MIPRKIQFAVAAKAIVALCLVPRLAQAEPEPVAGIAPDSEGEELRLSAPSVPEKPQHPQYVSLGLGVLTQVIESKGFDPFSRDDALAATTMFGTFSPWFTRPFSIHLAFEWDYGGKTAEARGIPTSIELHRLALGLEGRFLPISRILLFAKLMPAAVHVSGKINDSAFAHPLVATSWTWALDLAAGAKGRIAAFGDSEYPKASIWLGLDMGYRFAGPASMRLGPGDLTDEDAGRRFGQVPLSDLDVSGFVARLSGSVSF